MGLIQVDLQAFSEGIGEYFAEGTQEINEYNTLFLLNTLAFGAHIAIGCNTLYVLYRRREMMRRIPRALFVGSLLLLGVANFVYFSTGIWTAVRDSNIIVQSFVIECLSLFSPSTWPDAKLPDTSQIVSRCQFTSSLGVSLLLDSYFGRVESLGEDIPALLISILAQSYLVYRCFIIWSRKRFILWAYSPILLILSLFGIFNVGGEQGAAIDIFPNEDPGDVFFQLLPWLSWGLALALNISVTALIVGRLLWMRSKIRSALGKEHGSTYTGIAAILYESSLLYSLVVIIGYLALPGYGGTENMFSPVLVQTECIASELIILRLAQGLAFTDETATTIAQSSQDEAAA